MADVVVQRFADSARLANALAAHVAGSVQAALTDRGDAVLAVSGGNTPRTFLAALSEQSVDWQRVTVTLTDERWVVSDHVRSNERLLRETLLRGDAAAARFVSLRTDAIDPEAGLADVGRRVGALALPFDAVVLGLGNDGHCASLFADGDNFVRAMDPSSATRVLPMRSPSADEPRMTLTLPALINTRALYLHIEGATKQQTLARVLKGEGAYARSPLGAIVRHASVQLRVYACP